MPDNTNQAQQLCDLFTQLAAEVDAFRTAHYDQLSPQQRADLEEEIQQLYDFHDQFAGDVIQCTLDAVQGDLTKLTSVTKQATDALKHLQTVAKVVNIVAAAADLTQAIVTGGYGEIPEAVRSLAQAIEPSTDKDDNGA
jgi:phage I-like protein